MYFQEAKNKVYEYHAKKQYDKIDDLLEQCEPHILRRLLRYLETDAVEDDDLALVKILFKHEPTVVRSYFHYAVSLERTDIVDFLLESSGLLSEQSLSKEDLSKEALSKESLSKKSLE